MTEKKTMDEHQAIATVMREFKCSRAYAMDLIEEAVRNGKMTPVKNFSEAERKNFKLHTRRAQ